jgi:hemolysin activation/secretion protein
MRGISYPIIYLLLRQFENECKENPFDLFIAVLKMLASLKKYIFALSLFAFTILAYAEVPNTSSKIPDPVEQQRRIEERLQQQRESQENRPDVRLLPQENIKEDAQRLFQDENPCFVINKIVLNVKDLPEVKSPLYFDWTLEYVEKDLKGKLDSPYGLCLGAKSLNTILDRMQNALVSKGYVTTRALAGTQNLNSGVFEVTIIPGRITAIYPSPENSEFDNSRLNWRNALPMHPGDILKLTDIEQGLENLKRSPTSEADIEVVTSTTSNQPGQSDLVIRYTQANPFRLSVSFDDSGDSSTGKYLTSSTFNYDNMLTLNDIFYMSWSQPIGGFISQRNGGKDPGARSTNTWSFYYSVPIDNWTVTATASKTDYFQTVAGFTVDYVYSGISKNQDIKFSRLLYRDASRKIYGGIKGWSKQSKNFIDDTEVDVQRRRTAGVDTSINYSQYIGNVSINTEFTWRQGTGARKAIQAPEEAFGEGRSRPRIILGQLDVSIPFNVDTSWGGQNYHFHSSWRAQWNRTPLIPADRFSIGGRYTIRGYDGNMILQTNRGWLTRNELSAYLGKTGQTLYLAYDYGRVGGDLAEFMVTESLQSFAVGLRGTGKGMLKKLTYDVFVGWPFNRHADFRSANKTYGFSLHWAF